MIRLLRKIRQNLLSKSNYGQYILYATGEIVLVIIGILLALQIDNWNDLRKERILENQYLSSIKKELEYNIQEAYSQIAFSEFQQKNGELILRALADTSSINSQELAIAIEHVGWHHKLNFIRDVWDELYATGNIEILTDPDLKYRLSMLYARLESSRKFEEQEWMNYNLGIRRITGEILPPAVRLEIGAHLSPWEYNGRLEIQILSTDAMLARLKNVEGLNGYLSDIIMARKASQTFLNLVVEEMGNIENKLEDKIGQDPLP